MTLAPRHWATLIEAFRRCALRRLQFLSIDFSGLDADAFLAAVGCRGLRLLTVRESVFPNGFMTDDLIRASAARGLFELVMNGNTTDSPHGQSEEAVLDFFLSADPATASHRSLVLDGSRINDMFLTKLFEVKKRMSRMRY